MTKKRTASSFTRSIGVLAFVILVGTATAWGGGIKLRVSAEQANIREKPDIMSVILQQLPEGATLEAERKEGEWYAVMVEKEEGGFILGYVHESLVMVIEAAPPQQRERAEEQEPAVARPVEEKREEPHRLTPQTTLGPTGRDKRERMGVVFWLGGRHAAVGDLNDGAEGLAQYYESRLSAAGDGEVEKLHFGYLLGAEVRIPLASGFYLSLGAEHSSGEASSSIAYKEGSSEALYCTKPWLRITPISFALLYYPLRFIYVKAGIDYTFARCAYFYRFSYPDPYEQTDFWQEWKGEASSSGFGYQLGLGLEWSLGSRVSLIAEAAYRHGRLDDLEGEDFYQESTNYESHERGTLYRIQASAGGPETYPLVFIRDRQPSEAGVVDFRRAELDLSGYSLRLGLKVRF
jgi:opacity protein-like surface antigen